MKIKSIITCGVLLFLGGILVSNDTLVYAENDNSLENRAQGIVTNVDDQLKKMNEYYYIDNIQYKIFDGYRAGGKFDDQWTTINNFKMEADPIKNLKLQDMTPEYIATNTFRNTTDNEQTFSTASYSHAFENSTSTAVSRGFTIANAVTLFQIPLLLPNGVKITPNIDAGTTTKTKTDSETKTITVPEQQVNVPPHRTYFVEVNFLKQTLAGDINFRGRGTNLSSSMVAPMTWWGAGGRPNKKRTFTYPTNTVWKSLSTSQKNTITGVEIDNNSNFKIEGTASVKGIVGTALDVKTYDITNQYNRILVDEKLFIP